MIERVTVPAGYQLSDYELFTTLDADVAKLRQAGEEAAPHLRGRTIWMLSSTAQGGGVAEMLPREISLLRQLGIQAEWAVIKVGEPAFFALTKRLHNAIHGRGEAAFGPEDRELYEHVSRRLADALARLVRPEDLLVVHDPQPLGVGALLRRERGLPALWRCHIGLDRQTPQTRAAWEFLEPWTRPYDRAVFSLPEYVPAFLAGRTTVITPAIDPLSHKNRDLSVHKLTGILVDAGIVENGHPRIGPPFQAPALRLQSDGSFAPANCPGDLGVLFRPTVLQVSRWDRLKGFGPLLEGFTRLKVGLSSGRPPERYQCVVDALRLVLVGPDPGGVADDPEAAEVLNELVARWMSLAPALQEDIALLLLPMASRKENALMVNALQRCASIVAQNSLEEGFGLTVTEAMWKGLPILGSRAAGIRAQVRDGIEGRLVHDPEDPVEIALRLGEMLVASKSREVWGYNARDRVAAHYQLLHQMRRWLDAFVALARHASPQR